MLLSDDIKCGNTLYKTWVTLNVETRSIKLVCYRLNIRIKVALTYLTETCLFHVFTLQPSMKLLLLFQFNCVLCVLYYLCCFAVNCTSQNMCGIANLVDGEGHYNLSSELDLPACDYVDVEQLEGLRPNKYDISVLQLNIRGHIK